MRVRGEQGGIPADVPEDVVGRRVSCDGERGTVRFVGTVAHMKDLWLGVEWDNPERGKNDGSHEGVRYFMCSHPTGGSFVKPKKVSFGVDYLTAMKQRYEEEEAIGEEVTVSSKTVKMVGFKSVMEKQKLERLTHVILKNCEVSDPGPENEIQKNTPNVTSLDLSGNLLSSWEVVAAITEQLQELTVLILSCNRLRITSNPSNLSHAFSNLKLLSLNGCAVTWSEVLQNARMWPHLEQLVLTNNNITELQRPEGVLQDLKILDLSDNDLKQESLPQISSLSRLEMLNLCNTGLSVISFSDVLPGTKTAMFPALKTLWLDDNKITDWAVINELDKLRSLVQFSCKRNPIMELEDNVETTRQLLIARISQLEILNRCQVLPQERSGAELDYCKKYGLAWLRAGGNSNPEQNRPNAEFLAQHPRYLTLIQKYGAPEESQLQARKPTFLKDQLLTLTFVCPEEPDRKAIQKKLPGSMIVQKVKGMLYRLLKLPSAEIRLSYISSKIDKEQEFEMNNDLKTLVFYSIEDGDRILVRWS